MPACCQNTISISGRYQNPLHQQVLRSTFYVQRFTFNVDHTSKKMVPLCGTAKTSRKLTLNFLDCFPGSWYRHRSFLSDKESLNYKVDDESRENAGKKIGKRHHHCSVYHHRKFKLSV